MQALMGHNLPGRGRAQIGRGLVIARLQILGGVGELVITGIEGSSAFSIEITGGTLFDGSYTQDVDGQPLTWALVAGGPVCLVAPAIAGTAQVGADLSVTPGFWIYDGSGAVPQIASNWRRGAVDIQDADEQTYTVVAADQGQQLTVRETALDGNGTRTATSNAVAIAASLTLERVGGDYFEDDGQTDTEGEWTIDLTGQPAGRNLLIATGPNEYPPNLTITEPGGSAQPLVKLSSLSSGNSGARASLWRHVLAATGGVSAFNSSGGSTGNARYIAAFAFSGGAVADLVETLRNSGSSDLVATLNITNPVNRVLAIAIGRDWATSTWAGVSEIEQEILDTHYAISSAETHNVPVGPYEVRFNTNNADRVALITLCLEPV